MTVAREKNYDREPPRTPESWGRPALPSWASSERCDMRTFAERDDDEEEEAKRKRRR